MPTPTRQSRRSAAAAVLGAMRPAALAAALLAPAAAVPARANDRDLRATTVPAYACAEHRRSGFTGDPWAVGFFHLTGPGKELRLHCPLPLNNVDLAGITDDNDLSKLQVLYFDGDGDGDGFGAGAALFVSLHKVEAVPGGASGGVAVTSVCSWASNVDGTGSTTGDAATKACAHDLAADAVYGFDVTLKTYAGAAATAHVGFLGINFPL